MSGSSAKTRNKNDWGGGGGGGGGSPVASSMPKLVLSGGREDQLFR